MSVPRLQELYAQALARRSAAAEGCVSPEELLALVRKQGDEARRLQVLDHVMGCEACHREFELLRALEAAGGGSREPTTVRSISRRIMPLALAASVLLAIGVGLVMRNTESDITRGGGPALVLLTPPAEVAPAQPVTFSWRSSAGTQRYRLELLDRNGVAVFSQLTPDTSLTLPAELLQPGSTYRWWVRDATPGSHAASSLRALRIRSK
ncbi:MAG: hypothetical protein ACJ8AP_10445 [Gemmatimonadales bacterium]